MPAKKKANQKNSSDKNKKQIEISKEMEESLINAEEEIDELAHDLHLHTPGEEHASAKVISSKPIAQIKKGDKIKIDGKVLEVDAHVVLIDHGTTKEMAIECFDPKTDRDYQIRYFADQVERSIEVYELDEIIYNKLEIKKIEW